MSDVPEGYKMSEVGVIPEDWEVKTFEDIANKNVKWSITGGPFGSNLKASEYTLDGVRIVQLQNIGDGVFNEDYKIFTSDEKANELLSCNIYPNEIILSKMGDPVARACFIPNRGKRFLMSSDGIRLVVDESRFAKKFVHDYINSIYFRKRAIDASIGSTRLRIGLQDLKKLFVIAPPLPEQQAIASALSDVDALIAALEQLITKKRNIKQGAMQQLLTGEKRLPGFGGVWEVQKVSDFTLDKKGSIKIGPFGSQLKRETLVNQGYKVYGQENVYENNEELGDRFISTEHFNKLKSCELHPGDFVISMMGTIGKCMIMPNNIQNGIMDSHLLRLQLKNDNVDPIYLSQLFISSIIFNQIKQLSVGGIMDGLSSSIIQQINFPLPSFPEQQAIAQILSDMDTEIEALEQKRDKYKAIKQGMMQELLTGKRRLLA